MPALPADDGVDYTLSAAATRRDHWEAPTGHGLKLDPALDSPSVSFTMRKLSLWMGLEPPELEASAIDSGLDRI